MSHPLKIAWKHPAETFHKFYREGKEAEIARRWQALWLLRQGRAFEAGESDSGAKPQVGSVVGSVV
jgi:hypothetical protein